MDKRGRHGNHSKGSGHHRWNDELTDSMGYKLIRVGRDHPLADPNGYVREHTIVWIAAGRSIEPGQVIHHKNGDRKDNRLKNLVLMSREDHNKIHLPIRDPKTGRFTSKKRAGRLLDGREWNEYPEAQGQ